MRDRPDRVEYRAGGRCRLLVADTPSSTPRALRDIEVNLRTLAMTFSESYGEAKIAMKDGVVARAEIAKMPEFKDHAIVDRAVSYVGGNRHAVRL